MDGALFRAHAAVLLIVGRTLTALRAPLGYFGQAGVVNTSRKVLVLAPMAMELRPIVKRLGARRSTAAGAKAFVGVRNSMEITVSQLGVGPTMAAQTTERLLDQFPTDHVVV